MEQSCWKAVFDPTWFALKRARFEREFDALEMRDFRRPSCEAKSEPIDFATVMNRAPYFRSLLVDQRELRELANLYLPKLLPFCQAPFPLPGGQVVQGAWVQFWKQQTFESGQISAHTVAGNRVLDIGCNAGFDSFFLSSLGACEVIGVEPSPFYYQALFLWCLYYCPNLEFRRIRWQEVKPSAFGRFDLVNCQGLLYHEINPLLLLETIFDLLAPGGKLALETHATLDDDVKLLFIEGKFWGDPSWWWLPSTKATCAMLRSCGFKDLIVHSLTRAPSKNPADPAHTVEGIPSGGRLFVTARRPS